MEAKIIWKKCLSAENCRRRRCFLANRLSTNANCSHRCYIIIFLPTVEEDVLF